MQAVLTHLRLTEADTAASLSRLRDFVFAAFDAESDASMIPLLLLAGLVVVFVSASSLVPSAIES